MTLNWRVILVPAILILTAVLFIAYIIQNPQVIRELQQIPLEVILIVLLLYTVFFATLVLITYFSLTLYNRTITLRENFFVSAYSSLANFFGPGQSGPGVRAVYLKKRHQVPVKQFMFASLVYYAFYAIISGFMLLVGTRPWWQTALLVLFVAVFSALVLRWYARRSKLSRTNKGLAIGLVGILVGTVLQAATQVAIYYIEIQAINPAINFGQVVSYTGAANFSLFVALTPGAIGIREAFLFFSQNIHQVDSTVIVAANVIDRAVYLTFLGLLFIGVLSVHGRKKIQTFRSSE